MRVFDKQEIDSGFNNAIDAMQSKDIKAEDLSIYFGSLVISIKSRIDQLKSGVVKSVDKKTEIAKLEQASSCLKAKINTSTVSEMSQQIRAACRVYGSIN